MTATLHTFPARRVVRLPTSPRMSRSDLEALRERWPTGWHSTLTTDDGVAVDTWNVPSASYDLDLSLALIVTLQPNGEWTLTDDAGRLIAKRETVEEITAPA